VTASPRWFTSQPGGLGNEDRHDVLDGDEEQDFVLNALARLMATKVPPSTPVPTNV